MAKYVCLGENISTFLMIISLQIVLYLASSRVIT